MTKRGRKSIAVERRAQILDAFHRCAVRCGLEKASLREVAEEAGLPVSNLHHYFKNRDEMVSELVKQIMGEIIDTLKAEIQDLRDPQTRLKKIFEFLFSPKAQKLGDGSLYYDFWSLAHRSKTVRQTFQNQIRDQRETIFEVLLEASDTSKLSQADKKEIANMIIALVEGTFVILDMDGENVSPKKMAHLTTRFLELYAKEQMREKAG